MQIDFTFEGLCNVNNNFLYVGALQCPLRKYIIKMKVQLHVNTEQGSSKLLLYWRLELLDWKLEMFILSKSHNIRQGFTPPD